MNAAAKVIYQSTLFNGAFSDIRISKPIFLQIVLLFLVLASAISVVYTTNMSRTSFNQLQLTEQKIHGLHVQWGQLLLERTSLSTPTRVQQLAAERLQMMLPPEKQVFILKIN